MRLAAYTTTGVDTKGEPYVLTQKFTEIQALSIGANLTDEGLTLKDARHLLDHWNAMARAQGNTLVYGFSGEQLELIRQEEQVIEAEYHLLRQEAQDESARRMGSVTSIGAADAGLHTLRFRLKRIDDMTDEQLLASARRRAERESQSTPFERPRAGG